MNAKATSDINTSLGLRVWVSALWGAVEVPRRVLMLFLGLSLATAALAQTEVSGEVSGEWTAEGSPYIVVDSTWVVSGNTLILSAGIEVCFQADQVLYVLGTIKAQGTEEDTVEIYSPINPDGPDEYGSLIEWRGIVLGENSRGNLFYYTSIKGASSCIIVLDRSNVLIDHCLIDARWIAVQQTDCYSSATVTATNSTLIGNGYGIALYTGGVFVDNCELYGRGGGFRSNLGSAVECTVGRMEITNSRIHGNIYSNAECYTRYENDTLTAGLDGLDGDYLPYAYVGGGRSVMKNCYIQGDLFTEINTNLLIDSCMVAGDTRGEGFWGRGKVKNTTINGKLNIGGCDDFTFENCILNEVRSTPVDTLKFKNCVFRGNCRFLSEHAKLIVITGCLFLSYNKVQGSDLTLVSNNTFVYSTPIRIADRYSLYLSIARASETIIVENNIIMSIVDSSTAFFTLPDTDDAEIVIRHNIFFGWDSLIYYAGLEGFQPDETNLLEDPLLVSLDPLDPHLQKGSPCIDAGNPDSPLDPDGTRADIGARAFFQSNSVALKRELLPQLLSVEAFPNPFNSSLNIAFKSSVFSPVVITLFDLRGRMVATERTSLSSAGNESVGLGVPSLPSGRYLLRVTNGQSTGLIPVTCIK